MARIPPGLKAELDQEQARRGAEVARLAAILVKRRDAGQETEGKVQMFQQFTEQYDPRHVASLLIAAISRISEEDR
jgi:hypothetical protein